MTLYWFKVYGLGLACEIRSIAHDDTLMTYRRNLCCKLMLGVLLVNFRIPISGLKFTAF